VNRERGALSLLDMWRLRKHLLTYLLGSVSRIKVGAFDLDL